MTFCNLTIYNDNPLLIRLYTEVDLLPNFEWFPYNICNGCDMPTGDAYSSGHLVPSLWDLHMFYLLRPILFRPCRYFTGLCSSNIPRYFLDFAQNIYNKRCSTFSKLNKSNFFVIALINYLFFQSRLHMQISLQLTRRPASYF